MNTDKFEIQSDAVIAIQTDLANQGINEVLLTNLKAELLPLAEHEITTPEHYKLIQGAAKKLTNTRTIITSVCKRLRDPAIAYQKANLEQQKELLAIVAQVEEPILRRKEAWENIEQERMLEAARALATLHQNREKRLLEAGFRKDGESVWRLRDWSLTQDEVTGLGVVDGELHDWIDDCERQHKNLLEKERIAKEENDAIVEQARKNAERLEQLEREDKERKEKEARLQLRHDRGVELNIAANGGPWAIDRDLADLTQENFDRFKQEVFDAAQQLAQQPPPPEPADDPPVFDEAPPEEPAMTVAYVAEGIEPSDMWKLENLLAKLIAIDLPTLTPENIEAQKRQEHWHKVWIKDLSERIASL